MALVVGQKSKQESDCCKVSVAARANATVAPGTPRGPGAAVAGGRRVGAWVAWGWQGTGASGGAGQAVLQASDSRAGSHTTQQLRPARLAW